MPAETSITLKTPFTRKSENVTLHQDDNIIGSCYSPAQPATLRMAIQHQRNNVTGNHRQGATERAPLQHAKVASEQDLLLGLPRLDQVERVDAHEEDYS